MYNHNVMLLLHSFLFSFVRLIPWFSCNKIERLMIFHIRLFMLLIKLNYTSFIQFTIAPHLKCPTFSASILFVGFSSFFSSPTPPYCFMFVRQKTKCECIYMLIKKEWILVTHMNGHVLTLNSFHTSEFTTNTKQQRLFKHLMKTKQFDLVISTCIFCCFSFLHFSVFSIVCLVPFRFLFYFDFPGCSIVYVFITFCFSLLQHKIKYY